MKPTTLYQEPAARARLLDPPRWPGGPSICPAANLPAFVNEAALHRFKVTSAPDGMVLRQWRCTICGRLHYWGTHSPKHSAEAMQRLLISPAALTFPERQESIQQKRRQRDGARRAVVRDAYYKLDAGCTRVPFKEAGDCSVIAVAHCLGIPYTEAWHKLAGLGRKPRHGFHFYGEVHEKLGLTLRADLSCAQLATILPQLAQGRFIVRVSRHVFAVVDGKVLDTFEPSPFQRVKMVYEKSSPLSASAKPQKTQENIGFADADAGESPALQASDVHRKAAERPQ